MKELMKKAVEFGMPACRDDHGNLFGAIEFYQEATRAGVKPIIGSRPTLCHATQGEGGFAAGSGVSFHFARAKRRRLSQPGQTDAQPRTSTGSLPTEIRQGAAGATFGGPPLIRVERFLAGEVNSAIIEQHERAKPAAAEYRDILGAEIFMDCTTWMEEQRQCNRVLPQIAKDLGVGLSQRRCPFSATRRS